MIEVYKSTNKNYNKNGDMVLTPLSCVLYAEINGEIKIDLEHKYDKLGRWEYLTEENVIACPTPWGEKQLFRIYHKEKKLNKIVVTAAHVFFDLRHEVLIDVRPTDKTGEEALNIILAGTGYTGHSNIPLIETAYYQRKNIIAAIAGDMDQSFINRWGGEILPDNFDIYVYDRIGKDRGVKVEFGHNLKEIEETIDISNVITRIIPVGYDGIMLEGPEPWVDSPYINNYSLVYKREVIYEHIKVKESAEDTEGYNTLAEARAALRAAALADFEAGADKPSENYVVDMELLENTVEYKNYIMLETVQLGDTVKCAHKKIKIDVEARCINMEYDCIRKKTKKIELGEYVKTYFDEQREINKEVTTAKGNTYTKEQVNEKINEYLGKKITEELVTDEELKEILEDYAKADEVKDNITINDVTKALQAYSTTEKMQEAIGKALTGYVKTGAIELALKDYSTTEKMQEAIQGAGHVKEETYTAKIQEIESKLQALEEAISAT